MKWILLPLILLLHVSALAQSLPQKYSRVKINLEHIDISDIAALGLEADHGYYAKDRYLINDFSETEIALLKQQGVDYEILITDMSAWYAERSNQPSAPIANSRGVDCMPINEITYDFPTPQNYAYGSMGGYLTFDELLATLDDMQAKYPDLITVRDTIGDILSHEGRPIYWLRISDNPNVDETEPEVLYTALHHAREPNSLSQMIFYMWYLLENYADDPEVKFLVDHTELYFIPCINPDGYAWNQTTNPNGGGLWRKNCWVNENDFKVGVDLNRNYGYEWGYDDFGSSPNQSSSAFRGIAPFSEPETQAVRDFCKAHEFGIALNYHTSGNLLIHPWGYRNELTQEDELFKTMANWMIRDNDFLIGTASQVLGYVANGNSDDWMYGDTLAKAAIYTFTPEVGVRFMDGFWPAQDRIDPLNKSCMLQNLSVAHMVHNYGIVKDISADYLTATSGLLELSVSQYGLNPDLLTVSIAAGSANLTVDSSPKSLNLSQLESASLSFDYSIEPAIALEEEVLFLVQVDNGLYVRTDTLKKIFINSGKEIVLDDPVDDLSYWSSTMGWETTEETFYSAPKSITDSPGGDYTNNANQHITLESGLDLSGADRVLLRFRAKWDVEKDNDFVQVMISNDGVNFVPICGKYSRVTDHVAAADEPIYDGVEPDWVQEEIDISIYIIDGEKTHIRFRLYSDGSVTSDGFYFDDLQIIKFGDFSVGQQELVPDSSFDVSPNPIRQKVQVDFSLTTAIGQGAIVLTNSLGQVLHREKINQLAQGSHRRYIRTNDLPSGIYYIQLQINGSAPLSRKVLKID